VPFIIIRSDILGARHLTKITPLLSVRDLNVSFHGPHGPVRALRNISLDVHRGEIFAIVGESGSGKSTLARALMGITPIESGCIELDGSRLEHTSRARSLSARHRISMVFQDSASAFDPRFTVRRILLEPLNALPRALRRPESTPGSLLADVGLSPAVLDRYAHQLSGGQRQRVGIARALATSPDLLICDEAVSALDLSVQAQVLNLLSDLQEQRSLTFVFITHDLRVVEYLADRIGVMFHGQLIETGHAEQILDYPSHAYTQKLIAMGRNPHPNSRVQRIPDHQAN
jgi:ABC-type glutathione transport system ATPase component